MITAHLKILSAVFAAKRGAGGKPNVKIGKGMYIYIYIFAVYLFFNYLKHLGKSIFWRDISRT